MRDELPQFQDDAIYPVEASLGGDNAYYLDGCLVIGNRPNYAVCLGKIERRKDGRLDTVYADCSAAIGKKECPAMAMRKEEIAKGVALFYVSRSKLQAYQRSMDEVNAVKTENMLAGIPQRSKKQYKPSAPESSAAITPKKEESIDVGSDYAAAINRAMQEEAKRPTAPTLEAIVGESPIEYARRARQQATA